MSSIDPKDEELQITERRRPERILHDLEQDHSARDGAIDDIADYPLNSDIADNERSLLDNISASENDLNAYKRELKAADDALEMLARRNRQYEALTRVCGSLEELDELGAQQLFWGDDSNASNHSRQLEKINARITAFGAEVEEAEAHRRAVALKIGDQRLALDSLDTHLRNAMEREERQRAQWHVECDPRELPYREQIMPWARDADEDKRFRQSLTAAVLYCILLGLVLPMITLPTSLRSKLTEVPERVANVIRQERAEPVPPPVAVPVPELELDPVEPKERLAEEIVKEVPVANAGKTEAQPQVRSKGILAFRDSFASAALNRPSARLGSQANVSNSGSDAVGRPERSMVTSSAPGTSGGINLADLSRDVGGGGQSIDGVEVTRVASAIGTGEGPDRPLSAGLSAGRTDEEIQIVFDRYKAALYRLYNRELRMDPSLRGQLVLRLTIEPDGSVSLCEVQSSNMDAPALAQNVVARVRAFNFGAKDDIGAVTIIYPIDFLPSS